MVRKVLFVLVFGVVMSVVVAPMFLLVMVLEDQNKSHTEPSIQSVKNLGEEGLERVNDSNESGSRVGNSMDVSNSAGVAHVDESTLKLLVYPVSYDKVNQKGLNILPDLYAILQDERMMEYWYGALRAIGHLGRQPDSARIVKRCLTAHVEIDKETSIYETEHYSTKLASIHVLGLVSGPEEQTYLRELLSDHRNVDELCRNLSDSIIADDMELLSLNADVRAAACLALVFTRDESSVEYAKSIAFTLEEEALRSGLYNKEMAELSPDELYLRHLVNKLDDVMMRTALIVDIGIEEYLRIEKKPQAFASAILPYVFERNGISLSDAQVIVN